MLRDDVQKKMIAAMKGREAIRLEALRYVWSLIKNQEIDAKKELDDSEVFKVIQGEVKKRKEALRLAQGKLGGQVSDWVKDEEAKLKVLMEFLPEQMTEGEISYLVTEVLSALDTKDFGMIMREVMKKAQGRADGRLVSDIVKNELAGPDTIS